jgi:hypothetical protein
MKPQAQGTKREGLNRFVGELEVILSLGKVGTILISGTELTGLHRIAALPLTAREYPRVEVQDLWFPVREPRVRLQGKWTVSKTPYMPLLLYLIPKYSRID